MSILTYLTPKNSKQFRSLKCKAIGKWEFLVSGEWSQSMYHQGRCRFYIRHSPDKHYWAILSEGFPSRIVAAAHTPEPVALEVVAARMMRAVRDLGGHPINFADEFGDIDGHLFWKLYREKKQNPVVATSAVAPEPKAAPVPRREEVMKPSSPPPPEISLADGEVFADPWLKLPDNRRQLPNDARFACSYELDFGLDSIPESACLLRTDSSDELWASSDKGLYGRVFAIRREYDGLASCLKLLGLYIRARVGFAWPGEFLAAGMVDQAAFDCLVSAIEDDLEENSRRARSGECEIVKVSRELGLNPEPTGSNPDSWRARCPETNHPLFISSSANAFGCGWCKRRGSVEELRAFVKERTDNARGSGNPR